jgi:hypothetical protein
VVIGIPGGKDMRYELQLVFDHLCNYEVAIFGSALWKPWHEVNDIDVLVLAGQDFRGLCKELGLRYLGAMPRGNDQVRRASNFRIPGVNKEVQISQHTAITSFDQQAYAVLLRDGSILHPGCYFIDEDHESINGVTQPRRRTQ